MSSCSQWLYRHKDTPISIKRSWQTTLPIATTRAAAMVASRMLAAWCCVGVSQMYRMCAPAPILTKHIRKCPILRASLALAARRLIAFVAFRAAAANAAGYFDCAHCIDFRTDLTSIGKQTHTVRSAIADHASSSSRERTARGMESNSIAKSSRGLYSTLRAPFSSVRRGWFCVCV